MKHFVAHTFSLAECQKEIQAFESLLNSKQELNEKTDILPFFSANRHIASFISTYVPGLDTPDLIAPEYDIFGDFTCDLAIGDSTSHTYAFVEFEDAKKNSLFVSNGKKATPEWAPRLDHGMSQLVDWFWKLDDMKNTGEYANRFGSNSAKMHGLLILGRDQHLQEKEKKRLNWRQDHNVIASRKISILTFDQLLSDLKRRAEIRAELLPSTKP